MRGLMWSFPLKVQIIIRQYNIYEPALVAVNGKVLIPDAPGWGIEINPDFLEKTKYQISTLN